MDKKQMTSEQVLENIREFQKDLHGISIMGIMTAKLGLFGGTEEQAKECAIMHDISHALDKVIKGMSSDQALKEVFDSDDNDIDDVDTDKDSSFVGQIAVNVKTGDIEGIEDITDPKLKEQIAKVVRKLADRLEN